ncbi:MAG: hypothetical protein JWO05_433 [Gemmatimonadetes bacterium]|nr:hypothetical protein [Gemmatimonadota bacterium]
MMVLALVLQLAAASRLAAVRAPAADPWFAADKAKHFTSSAFTCMSTYGVARSAGASHRASLSLAWVATAGIGLWKERHDRSQGKIFSLRDLAWDAAGGAVATVVLQQVRR